MERKRGYGRMANRFRRIISSMLVLAMILTSVPATPVMAVGGSMDNLIEFSEEASTVVAGTEESKEEDTPVTSTESVESSEAASEESGESEETFSTEAVTDEQSGEEENLSQEDVTETNEATSESVETTLEDEDPIDVEMADTLNASGTGTSVLFQYKDSSATSANIMGINDDWATGIAMTEKDDVFAARVNLAAGTHEYKYKTNSGWEAIGGNHSLTVSDTNYPIINGNEVTFKYSGSDSTVKIMGINGDWATGIEMTKGTDGIFTHTMTLPLGAHTYKFQGDVNGWIIDPKNPSALTETGGNQNSLFIITGLESYTANGKKGEAITLPATLDYVPEDSLYGTVEDAAVTYTLKTEAAADYVTIDNINHTITVDAGYTANTMELTASTADGGSSIVTLNLVDQMYTYTVYAYSNLEDRMNADETVVHIWGTDDDSAIAAENHVFTETEVIGDKTWLKTVVSFPSPEKIGIMLKEKEANADNSQWCAPQMFYENTDKAENTTLYVVDGQSTVFTDISNVKYTEERYLIIDYTRDDGIYTGANIYSWETDYGTANYAIKECNGAYLAQIPILPSDEDKNVKFIVKTSAGWDDSKKDGGDNIVTIPAGQKVVKLRYANGEITEVLPKNTGSTVDRSENIISFYYRDDMKFADNTLSALKDKVQVVLKSSTGNEAIDGTFNMTYDADAERFVYTDVPLVEETDYYYYYLVDGVKVLDPYNDLTEVIDDTEYNMLRNVTYELTLSASVKNPTMDYNDNNLLTVSWEADAEESLDGFVVKEMYADLSELGLSSKAAIDPKLNALTIGCRDNVAAGEKTIKVTVIDNAENKYVTETSVIVTERKKTANTDAKLGDFDWDEAVIYFAVTDRFFDGNTANNTATEGYDPTDETDQSRYHGGDLAGLTAKIDYLYDLGVNTIWLTPIVDNVDLDVGSSVDDIEYYAYHGYWAEDFTKLNPHMGTEAELKALINAAHAKGMKIMVDVVLNHAGYEATDTFNTILKDKDGNYINMIRGAEDTISGDEKKDSLSGLPDFLTENEEVRKQLVDWQTYWMTEYDIDYYRVDTVKHVDNTTWSAFKNALTESNPDFKMIGEYYDATYTNQYDQLDTGRMDSLLDFGFKYYAKDFVAGNMSSAEANLAARNNALSNTATMGSFLSSHDENGMLYNLLQNAGADNEWWAEAQMKVAATLQITAKGQPVIYYGEEIGMSGASNYPYYDNRYDFDWDKVEAQQADENSMYNHYKKLLNIRRDYSEVFAKGDRRVIAGSDAVGYEVIRRNYDGTSVYVGMNVWGDDATASYSVSATPGSTYKDLYSNQTYTVVEDGTLTITIPKATEGGTAVLVLAEGSEIQVEDTNTITLKLHYNRPDADYTDWNAWLWTLTKAGMQYEFEEENGEMVATIEVEGRSTTAINYIIRKGEWEAKDVDKDQSVDVSDILSGTVHFYVNSGVEGGTRVLGADAITGSKIINASYDRDAKEVIVKTSMPISGSAATAFTIRCTTDDVEIGIKEAETNGSVYTLTLDKDISSIKEAIKNYEIIYEGYSYPLSVPSIYTSEDFEANFTYTGDDLGANWSKEATTFKVWAPTADKAKVAIYASGTEGTDDKIGEYAMTLGEAGVWSVKIDGNLDGYYYTYLVTTNGEEVEACDPYARTTGVNGKRAMVLDLDSTDPEGWAEDKGVHDGMNYTDAVIYELHVRDASIHESSGVSEANKGKYLGLTETGTTTDGGVSTALDHIKDLGVTHVHLLPVYDYGSVDETRLDEPQFNWGYDPVNYNVPEGSYSTDPYNGEVRVKEFKQMVKTMHDNNINVIMDVVYNHVYDADSFCFNQIVPKYFSRTNADGSYTGATGCGNDTASEREMVRKYIVDSVLYWAKEYHIDGFRFDLVGILDVDTMNAVIEEVHKYDPDIIFYGEGWNMTSVDGETMATQGNAAKTPELAFFSDTFRDTLAGNNTNGQGYVLGASGKDEAMLSCLTAASWWCPSPTQTVNYASCHDNYTLKDKLNVAAASATEAERIKMNNLSAAMYMLAEGIPFIHAGEEFLRTKVDEDGEIIHNSYKSSDYVNAIRWNNLEKAEYADVADYYKGLIEFRKNHEALRLTTSAQVAANVNAECIDTNTILYKINGSNVAGEVADNIVVIFNSNKSAKTVNLSSYGSAGTEWKVCIDGENAGTDVLRTISADGSITVDPISAVVLVQGETVDTDSVYIDNVKEKVSLDKKAVNLKVGDSVTLTATVYPTDTVVEWSSDKEEVATVDAGTITAKSAGKAVITAKTSGGSKAVCVVTVSEDGYFISEEEITLDLTTAQTKALSVTDTEGKEVEVTWSSVSENIVTVSENGIVTPVSVGTTTVNAKVTEEITLSCEVTVYASLTSISVTPAELELKAGDTAQLSIACDPIDATVGEAIWLSSNASVATVDKTGKVTAVGGGKAVITAKVDGKTATCTVRVKGVVDEENLQIPQGITAITNIHKTLADITLPDGWSWKYGDIPVKAFVGAQTKNFQAEYKEGDNDPVTKEIPVSIVTVSKVIFDADKTVIENGNVAKLTADIVTTGGVVPTEMINVTWKSSKESVARVLGSSKDKLAATLISSTKGATQVTATITISDGKASKAFTSAKKKIQVVDEALANIYFKDLTGLDSTDVKGVYKYDYLSNGQKTIKVTIASTSSKVTIKSSDAKVVKTQKATKNAAGDFETTLTIKKAGHIKLTAIANDVAKTQTSIEIYVKDATPNVNTNTVNLNNKSSKTASVFVYPNEDYTIESVSVNSPDFVATNVEGTDEYVIAMADASKPADKGNYKQKLMIKVKDATGEIVGEYPVPLTIKVASTAPAVTVKQTAKVNLFYNDEAGNGSLTLTSKDKIEAAYLTDCDYVYDFATGQISVSENGVNSDKKGVLTVYFEDYAQPVTKNITIATQNKKPSIVMNQKSAVLYPNSSVEVAYVVLRDAATNTRITMDEIVSVKFTKDNAEKAYEITKNAEGKWIQFTRTDTSFTSKATAEIRVRRANYTDDVVLSYSITVNKKDASLALTKSSVTLNKNASVSAYEMAYSAVNVKNNVDGGFNGLAVEPADQKTQKAVDSGYLKAFLAAPSRNVQVEFGDATDLKGLEKGNYKFKVTGKDIKSKDYKPVVLTVKVVDVAPEKTVKLTKSGSIDVLNRDTTSIVYKPKLSNITGQITDVSLTGRSAHLFKAELVDGNIKVTIKGNDKEAQNAINLVTKYNYGINLRLTLDNGEDTCQVVTGEQKFKLTQSKPKLTVVPNQSAMFNTVDDNEVSVQMTATNKDGSKVNIESIELTNFTNAFAYDKDTGILSLTGRSDVVKGKTYSLKFKVYYEGCADSEKPASVTYKVKVN